MNINYLLQFCTEVLQKMNPMEDQDFSESAFLMPITNLQKVLIAKVQEQVNDTG